MLRPYGMKAVRGSCYIYSCHGSQLSVYKTLFGFACVATMIRWHSLLKKSHAWFDKDGLSFWWHQKETYPYMVMNPNISNQLSLCRYDIRISGAMMRVRWYTTHLESMITM